MKTIAGMFSNRLSQLSFDALMMQFNGDKRRHRLRMVKWAKLTYSPDMYFLMVDSLTLPRGRGITEAKMAEPDVVQSLGLTVQRSVSAHLQEGVGLWYFVSRGDSVGNLPRYCDYTSVREQAKAKGLTGLVKIPIGFTSRRHPAVIDFHDEVTAHLLIGGAPGGGKSSLVHLLICHLIQQPPELVKLSLFDFKRVELRAYYDHVPHLAHEIITDPHQFLPAVSHLRREVERRYDLMAKARVEHIKDYNARHQLGQRIPDLFLIVDELASLYVNPEISRDDRGEIDGHLGFIAMQARACGVHLILATQRPSADVLSGYIRACMATRIGFACASVNESIIIIGTGHAAFKDSVPLGRAVMVRGRFEIPFQTAWISKPQRRELAEAAGSAPRAEEAEMAALPDLPERPPTFRGSPITIQELAHYAEAHLNGLFSQKNLYEAFRDKGVTEYAIRDIARFYSRVPFDLDGMPCILRQLNGNRRPLAIEYCRETVDGSKIEAQGTSLPSPVCLEG